MRVNNTLRKIIDCFWGKHCRDSACQTSFIVFQKFTCAFSFVTRSLIDRCQIMTERIMFQSLFESLLNHLYNYANKNVSVKHLSLTCITSILATIYSLKNCSVHGRSQFFTIRTSQPANNICLLHMAMNLFFSNM